MAIGNDFKTHSRVRFVIPIAWGAPEDRAMCNAFIREIEKDYPYKVDLPTEGKYHTLALSRVEIASWCDQHSEHPYYFEKNISFGHEQNLYEMPPIIYFMNKVDAVHFKMRWL